MQDIYDYDMAASPNLARDSPQLLRKCSSSQNDPVPNLVLCADSNEKEKIQAKNISDFLANLKIRAGSEEYMNRNPAGVNLKTQHHLTRPDLHRPIVEKDSKILTHGNYIHRVNVNVSSSSGKFEKEESSVRQSGKDLHESPAILDSKSGQSSFSDDISNLYPPKKTFKIDQLNEKCLTNSQNLYRLLVHSRRPRAEPIARVAEANFSDSVHKGMYEMGFSSVYRTQSVAWPHILRGNSMMVINTAASGKTMSFLPAICSLVEIECVEQVVPDGVGPVAVILCLSSVKVVEVAELCRRFLSDFKYDVRVVESCGERNINRVVPFLLNGCGLLVCTVPNLHRLLNLEVELNQKLFDRCRIKHLVIDDIDLFVGRFSNELNFIRKSICPRAPNGETMVQIVLTARMWRPMWSGFFKLGMNPILCIGTFIEAAVYARSELQLKLIAADQKFDQVLAILRERNYMHCRTIVVCNQSEEVFELVRRLNEVRITPAYCHDNSTIAEISAAKSWNLEAPPGQNTVFVCTDEKLVEVDIKLAQNIIHYSLPSNWTQFSFRFSAMSDYFENFIVNETPTKTLPFSLVLLDENNNQQLPRLIDFVLEHDVTDISNEIRHLAQKIRRDIEDKHRIEFGSFCPEMLLLGKCNISGCKYRHSLTYSDRSKDLPRNGRIKMEILCCHSPSYYSVRILEHLPPGAKLWTRVSREYLAFSVKFQNYYAITTNHRAHIPVVMGDLCVLPTRTDYDSSYHRCQIIRVHDKCKKITVRLIDVGTSLDAIHAEDLLELSAEFVGFPSQAVDVRIANLLPYDFDSEWDKDSLNNVRKWLQKNKTQNVYIEGTIQWSSCLNTIWVDTLRLIEKLYTSTEVFVLSIRRKLLDEKFGVVDDRCLLALKQMAASCGIYDEPSEPVNVVEMNPSQSETKLENEEFHFQPIGGKASPKSSSSSTKQSNPSEMKTSKLDLDLNGASSDRWVQMQPNIFQFVSISTFHTPWRFYLQILTPELYKLYDSIDEFTAKESNRLRINGDITVGMMCLGKAFGAYNRAKVMAIEVDGITVTVFFVDLGQSSLLLMNDLLAIPDYLIEKEPFQAVLCSLVSIRPTKNEADWDRDLCDRMYDEILIPCTNMAIQPIEGRNGPKSDLGIRSYDCILVDMDDNDQTITLNDRLVSSGLADYDLVDRHYLTVNRYPIANPKILESDDDSGTPENWDIYQKTEKCDAASETNSSDNDGIQIFDYNFTEDEAMEALRSLLHLPSKPEELFGINTSEPSKPDITEITDNKFELNNESVSESEIIQSLYQPELLDKHTNIVEPNCWNIQMPALKRPAAVPNVKWQQGNSVLMLVIEAPDVLDYYLHVTTRSLQYSCIIGEIPQMLHMNLFGCIDTEYTSHEVRGLSVYVRLIKTLRGQHFMWPRLLAADDRHQWLKYNTEAISLDETPKHKFMKFSNHLPVCLDSDDSDCEQGTETLLDLDNADPFTTEFD